MAEENESPANEPARRVRRTRVARASQAAKRPVVRTSGGTFRSVAAKPVRSVVILSMVVGLVAAVGLPAYAAWRPEAEVLTTQQVAAENAQSLVVASDASDETLARGSYAATTPEEIEKKKAEEAAAARAKAAIGNSASVQRISVDLNMVAPGSGEIRWPLTDFTYGEINLFRPPSRPNHDGFDMLAPQGTPIYASMAGVVRVSQNGYGGYGEAVVIDSVVAGQAVTATYGHMVHGGRQVEAGQTVAAGQLIGLVGSTGNSTANHCHFEVRINGALIDPLPWLQANAG